MLATRACLLVALLTMLLVPPASAVVVGGFEIDGDLASDGDLDWSTVGGQPAATDPVRSTTDSSFRGGATAKEEEPENWVVAEGAVSPIANDVGDVYAASATTATNQYVFLGFERAVVGGSIAFNLELNQVPNVTNANGVLVPNRTVGDILIDIQQSGQTYTTSGAYQWDGASWVPLPFPGGGVTGQTNTSPVVDLEGNTLAAGLFAEVAVDLTLLTGISPCPGANFSTFNLRSRSSPSITSTLKDYVPPGSLSVRDNCGSLRVEKRDEAGDLLPGATFSFSPSPVPPATLDDPVVSPLVVRDGGPDDPDGLANGVLEWPQVVPGTYEVTETIAPPGYLLSGDPQTAQATSGELSTLTYVNQLGSVSWRKLDDETGDPVCCATFTVEATGGAAADLFDGPVTVVDNGPDDADPADGAIRLEGLFTGTYQITETVPPEGYDLPTADNPRTIAVTQAAPDPAAGAFRDPRLPGRIDVAKVDAVSDAPLDATFALWRDDGDGVFDPATDTVVVPETSTTDGALSFEDLDWGAYWLEEVTPPTGYEVAPGSPFAVTVGAQALEVELTVRDPRVESELTVDKRAEDTGEPLSGAEFRLWRDDAEPGPSAGDTEVGTCVTTDAGGCTIDGLDFGSYYWEEVSPPVGYVLPAEVFSSPIVVDAENAGTTLPATEFVDPPEVLALSLSKVGTLVDSDGDDLADVGETITYAFDVTNDGNTPVTQIAVDDDKVGEVSCPPGPLAPGATVTCTASYVVVQADVDAGEVENTATASAVGPRDQPVESDPATDVVPADQTPAVELVKTGEFVDADGDGAADAGESITYTFEVTNAGTVTLDSIAVDDPKLGEVSCPSGPLPPQETVECTGTYEISQAEADAGLVTNSATVSGTPPEGDPVTDEDDAEVPLPRQAALSLDKVAGDVQDLDGNGPDVGDVIVFGFRVTNTGTVTLDAVSVSDPLAGGVSCPSEPLPPGSSLDCTPVAYVITQDDINAGSVDNTATAEAVAPEGAEPPEPAEDSTSTPVEPRPSLAIEKTAGEPVDVNGSGLTDAGDEITYTFTVSNDGNVPISDVTVTDEVLARAGIAITCEPAILAPGETADCGTDGPYVVTEADEAAGSVDNVATATGTDPDGVPTTSPEDETSTETAVPEPRIVLDKQADEVVDVNGNGLVDAGDEIRYRFTVTNEGNVPVDDLAVEDDLLAEAGITVTCEPSTVAPGDTAECATDGRYVITQADVDGGDGVVNTATVTGTDPDGDPAPEDTDEVTVPTDDDATLRLDKQADPAVDVDGDGRIGAGDTIAYTFLVENTGVVTVDAIAIEDPLLAGLGIVCAADTLAPGERTTCASSQPYAITPADVDAGEVTNDATATGSRPGCPACDPVRSNPDSTSTDLTRTARLEIAKTAELRDDDGDAAADPGERIEYSFRVTSTGTAPVDGIAIVDDLLAAAGVSVSCPRDSLAPGASMTCSATYTVRASDIADGVVQNTATATGTGPDGEPVESEPSSVLVPADEPHPAAPPSAPDPSVPLPETGGARLALAVAGLLSLIGGGALLARERRRTTGR